MHILYSGRFLKHFTGRGHPECPERLGAILKVLKANPGFEFAEPSPASEEDLLLVHTEEHLRNLEHYSASERVFPDNPFSKATYSLARLAAGAALDAAVLSPQGFAFALVRPPGHHAGPDYFAGFCYLNNLAFAIRKTQRLGKAERVLVVDFDLHHGNGTQDIFRDDPTVLYLSLNQDPAFTYPGSGFETENSRHIRNVVVPAGATEAEYLRLFSSNFAQCLRLHNPDLIAVSAGFDTFGMDQIGSRIRIFDSSVYNEMGKAIAKCGVPAFGTLEGGYYLPALGQNVLEFLSAFQQGAQE